MDDAQPVRSAQRGGHLRTKFHATLNRKWPLVFDQLAQVVALEKFHCDKRAAILDFIQVFYPDRVFMSQSAGDGGFMAEAPQEIFISSELAGDHFDCAHLVEQPVPCAVDNRHSSRPNPPQNDVLATDDHPRFKLSGNTQSLVISGADLKLVRKEVLACSAVFHLQL